MCLSIIIYCNISNWNIFVKEITRSSLNCFQFAIVLNQVRYTWYSLDSILYFQRLPETQASLKMRLQLVLQVQWRIRASPDIQLLAIQLQWCTCMLPIGNPLPREGVSYRSYLLIGNYPPPPSWLMKIH